MIQGSAQQYLGSGSGSISQDPDPFLRIRISNSGSGSTSQDPDPQDPNPDPVLRIGSRDPDLVPLLETPAARPGLFLPGLDENIVLEPLIDEVSQR